MPSLSELPLNKPLDHPLPNTLWTVVRAFLYVGAFFAIGAAVLAMIAWRSPGSASHGSSPAAGWWAGVWIVCSFLGAMLLSAGISCFSAWRGGQALNALRNGSYFARWDYDAATWAAYGIGEGKTMRMIGWTLIAIATLSGIMISFGLSITPDTRRHKAFEISIFDTCDVAFIVLVYLLFRFFGNWRRAVLQRRPLVIIGPNAVYSGGDLLFWNSGGNGLYSARFISPIAPNTISSLELVVGMSRGGEKIAKAADAALILAGRVGAVSSYRVVRKIPVPLGQEDMAREICRKLMQEEMPATPHVFPAPTATSPHVAASLHPSPLKPVPAPLDLEPRPRRAGNWWKITGVMIGTGILFFCVTVFDGMRTGDHPTNAAAFIGTIGAFIAMAAVVPLIAAIWLSVRDLVNRN